MSITNVPLKGSCFLYFLIGFESLVFFERERKAPDLGETWCTLKESTLSNYYEDLLPCEKDAIIKFLFWNVFDKKRW